MALITERYKDRIVGMLSCCDRMILQGTLHPWCFADGMTGFLYRQGIRIFDYPQFAQGLNEAIRQNAESVAKANGLEIEFIRKVKAFRKEDRLKKILKERGNAPGLVHIFSAMESCTSYKPWHDKPSGKTHLKMDSGKCRHYYFYFLDPVLGLCYVRVPTWCPFRLQVYVNGHNWLAGKLQKHGLAHVLQDNAFLQIADFEKAQSLANGLRAQELHQALDRFAQTYCPVFKQYGLSYHWSLMQVEYATDIVFKRREDLQAIYEPLIRIASHSVKPEDIASFLGQKLHGHYQGEVTSHFKERILGTRIKHQKGKVGIKMYDKFGLILRIETTVNEVSEFKHYREVHHRNGTSSTQLAPMRKTIYSLPPLPKLLCASNRRYLEFLSTFDDPSLGIKRLHQVSRTVTASDRPYKGFNFFCENDSKLFTVLNRGEFNINGFQNKDLRQHFPDNSSAQISRTLKRLYLHGLIKKVRGTYKYYLTKPGKTILVTGLKLKQMVVIPDLAGLIAYA